MGYLMGCLSLLPDVRVFTISSRLIGFAADNAYLLVKVNDGYHKDI